MGTNAQRLLSECAYTFCLNEWKLISRAEEWPICAHFPPMYSTECFSLIQVELALPEKTGKKMGVQRETGGKSSGLAAVLLCCGEIYFPPSKNFWAFSSKQSSEATNLSEIKCNIVLLCVCVKKPRRIIRKRGYLQYSLLQKIIIDFLQCAIFVNCLPSQQLTKPWDATGGVLCMPKCLTQ